MAAKTQFWFSTGKVRIGPIGATLTDADHLVGAIQSASIEVMAQKAEVMETPQTSMFPVAVGFHSGQCRVRLEMESFDRRLWTTVLNAKSTPSGNADLITIDKLTQPQFFKIEIDGLDAKGKQCKATFYRACAPGLSLNTRLTNFATMPLDVEAYPSEEAGATLGKVCDLLFAQ